MDGFAPNLARLYGSATYLLATNFLAIGQGVWIPWGRKLTARAARDTESCESRCINLLNRTVDSIKCFTHIKHGNIHSRLTCTAEVNTFTGDRRRSNYTAQTPLLRFFSCNLLCCIDF